MDTQPLDGLQNAERLASLMKTAGDFTRASDQDANFPDQLANALSESDLLATPLPNGLGGSGLGTEGAQADATHELLYGMGAAWLPLGRIFESHLNALRLILLYGTEEQAAHAAADTSDGHVFAVWTAEDRHRPVLRTNGEMTGVKTFASGVHVVTRALVTAQDGGERMVLVQAPGRGWQIGRKPDLQGMRGTDTAAGVLTGLSAPADALIGEPGDYMRQPEISLGAWRPLAVLAGGLAALAAAIGTELNGRGRTAHPLQRARLGALLVAEETARLWSLQAGRLAETEPDEESAAYVKLARAAVDQACTTAIQLAQRSAGLAAFARPHPIERLCRDLATYMRQPALDEVIDEAAAHFLGRAAPE